MNYIVKAVRIFLSGSNTKIEDYSKEVPNYTEALKEENRLKSLGEYEHIRIDKIKEIHS